MDLLSRTFHLDHATVQQPQNATGRWMSPQLCPEQGDFVRRSGSDREGRAARHDLEQDALGSIGEAAEKRCKSQLAQDPEPAESDLLERPTQTTIETSGELRNEMRNPVREKIPVLQTVRSSKSCVFRVSSLHDLSSLGSPDLSESFVDM